MVSLGSTNIWLFSVFCVCNVFQLSAILVFLAFGPFRKKKKKCILWSKAKLIKAVEEKHQFASLKTKIMSSNMLKCSVELIFLMK